MHAEFVAFENGFDDHTIFINPVQSCATARVAIFPSCETITLFGRSHYCQIFAVGVVAARRRDATHALVVHLRDDLELTQLEIGHKVGATNSYFVVFWIDVIAIAPMVEHITIFRRGCNDEHRLVILVAAGRYITMRRVVNRCTHIVLTRCQQRLKGRIAYYGITQRIRVVSQALPTGKVITFVGLNLHSDAVTIFIRSTRRRDATHRRVIHFYRNRIIVRFEYGGKYSIIGIFQRERVIRIGAAAFPSCKVITCFWHCVNGYIAIECVCAATIDRYGTTGRIRFNRNGIIIRLKYGTQRCVSIVVSIVGALFGRRCSRAVVPAFEIVTVIRNGCHRNTALILTLTDFRFDATHGAIVHGRINRVVFRHKYGIDSCIFSYNKVILGVPISIRPFGELITLAGRSLQMSHSLIGVQTTTGYRAATLLHTGIDCIFSRFEYGRQCRIVGHFERELALGDAYTIIFPRLEFITRVRHSGQDAGAFVGAWLFRWCYATHGRIFGHTIYIEIPRLENGFDDRVVHRLHNICIWVLINSYAIAPALKFITFSRCRRYFKRSVECF